MKSHHHSAWVIVLSAGLGLASVAEGAPRILKSADGSKTISAEILDVLDSPQGRFVELELENHKRIKTPATAFSEADQKHFDELAKVYNAARTLSLRIDEQEGDRSKDDAGGRRITTVPTAFSLDFRNGGTEAIKDVEAHYRIFYKKAVRKGQLDDEKVDKVEEGTLKIEALAPRETAILDTAPIELVSDRPNVGGPG